MSEEKTEVSIADFRKFLEREGRSRRNNHAGNAWNVLRRELKKGAGDAKDEEVNFDPRAIRGLLDRNAFGQGRSKGKESTRPNYVRGLGSLLHGDLDDFLKELGI